MKPGLRMNTHQIKTALRGRIGPHASYVGVLFADQTKSLLRHRVSHRPVLCIINTLPSYSRESMGHWIAVCYVRAKLIFFDSFGQDPRIYSWYFQEVTLSRPDISVVKYNVQVQHMNTLVCGVYAIFFVYNIAKHGLETIPGLICKFFSRSDYLKNDKKILEYGYTYFNLPNCYITFRGSRGDPLPCPP